MPGKARTIGILAAAALLVAGTAHADAGDGEFDVVVGEHYASDRSALGAPTNTDQLVARDNYLVGLRLGYYLLDRLAVELEVVAMPTHSRGDAADDATLVGYRAQVAFEPFDRRFWWNTRLALIFGVGALGVDASANSFRTGTRGGIHADQRFTPYQGASVMHAFSPNLGLRLDARVLWLSANDLFGGPSFTVDVESTVGLYVFFGGPGTPRVRTHETALPAPPPPGPIDSDGDGVPDSRDPCPDQAEDKDGFQDDDGCPEDDNDLDGVLDAQDQCPEAAEDRDGYKDDDGCPDPDNDSDGLLDPADKCPNEAEDKDGFEDDDGCPDPDNDRDGVPDGDDRCPAQAETWNGFQDHDGCADELPRPLQRFVGVVAGVQFAPGAATLTRGSFRRLDAVVKVMEAYPDVSFEIGGHTDGVGDAAANQELSQARADAVRAYLMAQGIASGRLRAVGYGATRPLDVTGSPRARLRNQRVELQLIIDQGVK